MNLYVESLCEVISPRRPVGHRVPLNSSFSHWMHPNLNVLRWPTRLAVMIAFNSTAIHKGPCLSGIFSSSQRLAPIHYANLVGSHRKTGCVVLYAYVRYSSPASRIHTVILNNIGGHRWRDGVQRIHSKPCWLQKVNVNILLSTPPSESADSLQDR